MARNGTLSAVLIKGPFRAVPYMLDTVHFQMALLFCRLPFCSVAAPGHPFCPVRVRHGLFARGGHSGLSE